MQGIGSIYPAIDDLASDLILSLLKFNPNERISPDEAIRHPYFDEIKKKGYLNSYQNNNQHFQQEDGKPIPLSVALNPVPLNVDREKLGEAAENIKINVSAVLLLYFYHMLTVCLFWKCRLSRRCCSIARWMRQQRLRTRTNKFFYKRMKKYIYQCCHGWFIVLQFLLNRFHLYINK